jgi:hypothetical protein
VTSFFFLILYGSSEAFQKLFVLPSYLNLIQGPEFSARRSYTSPRKLCLFTPGAALVMLVMACSFSKAIR